MFADVQASCLRALFVTGLIATTSLPVASAGPASASQRNSTAERARVVGNYGKLPLSFEVNAGQADKGVKFLSRESGYGLYLTGNEALLTLRKAVFGAAGPGPQRRLRPIQKSAPSDVVRMRLAGESGKAEPMGEEQLPGTANYFIGNDPAKWRTGIPTYARVRYAGIYSGIDLVYYGNQRQLEFDFVVAPGADPGAVAMDLVAYGDAPLRITGKGELVIPTTDGAMRFHRPLIYQMVDGHRHPVAGGFALVGKHTVGFRLGSYDRTKPLVIDPVLAYSTFLGGSAYFGDKANAIAVDDAGNVYVAGQTYSSDFPVTPGAYQSTNQATANQFTNVFITKLNATGTALVYSTYLGGSGTPLGGDKGHAIAVDAEGNVYVTGQTYSTDFPVTPGAYQATNRAAANNSTNAFVSKLNPTGTALICSTYLGGTSVQLDYPGDVGNAIAVDAEGNVYVAGQTYSTDFPVTPGAFQATNRATATNNSNAFVTKLNPAGTALLYSTYLGGSGGQLGVAGDSGNAIVVDPAGDAVVAGYAYSTDYPVTARAYQATNLAAANQSANAFVSKLNTTGTALVYSTYLGGGGLDMGEAIAADSAGNVYVAGQTRSTDFPVTSGAFQTMYRAGEPTRPNAFVTKLNPAGEGLVYSTYLGGSGGIVNQSLTLFIEAGDSVNGLAIDGSGNAYVAGSTASADFPVTQDAYQSTNHDQCSSNCVGGYNAFVTELNSTGSALTYSTYLGGRGLGPDFALVGPLAGDQANGLALDSSGNVYVAGSAQSFDFPVTAGAFQMMVASWCGNAFVTKLIMGTTSTATAPTVTVTPSSSTITSGQPLTVTVSVSGGSGNPAPTGTVTLASGDYASPSTTLAGGVATLKVSAQANVMVAMYVPDTASSSTYNFSSGVASVNVVGPNILVTPSSSNLTWAQAQSQALPVAIALSVASGYPTPTGTVSLTVGSWTSANAMLSGGNATIDIPPATLPLGFDALNLDYSGDSNYAAIVGVPGSYVTVGKLSVSVAPASSTINMNQALPVTITVSEVSGGPTPTGTVTLNWSGYMSAATPLANGSATITIPGGTLLPGTDILGADYTGGNYAAASGQATVTVTGTPSFSIKGTAVTVTAGATTGNTSTITVTPAGGFTGSVSLTAAVTSSPSGARDSPTLNWGSTSPVSIPTPTAQGIATLTISTTAPVVCAQDYRLPLGVIWCTGTGAALACVLLLGIPARRRRWALALGILTLLTTLICGLPACGGGRGSPPCTAIPGTTAGVYTITVTGTAGSTTATGTVSLTVQ